MKMKLPLLLMILCSASMGLFAQEVLVASDVSQNIRNLNVIDRVQTNLNLGETGQTAQTAETGDTTQVAIQKTVLYAPRYEIDKVQLKQLYPEIIFEDDLGNISVDYNSLILLQLIEIQALRNEVDVLTAELESLKNTKIN